MALSKLRLCDLFWVAWTEFGSVGEGRRAVLTQIDRKRQAPGHPGVDPVGFKIYRETSFSGIKLGAGINQNW
jgi:hypothetical protein